MITLPKLLLFTAISLFGMIGTVAFFKNDKPKITPISSASLSKPIEVNLGKETRVAVAQPRPIPPKPIEQTPPAIPQSPSVKIELSERTNLTLPDANRIEEFFNKEGPVFPIVE